MYRCDKRWHFPYVYNKLHLTKKKKNEAFSLVTCLTATCYILYLFHSYFICMYEKKKVSRGYMIKLVKIVFQFILYILYLLATTIIHFITIFIFKKKIRFYLIQRVKYFLYTIFFFWLFKGISSFVYVAADHPSCFDIIILLYLLSRIYARWFVVKPFFLFHIKPRMQANNILCGLYIHIWMK